ncbi:unnamed protein product [Vitrella brassicaformis CCMP3155]|uniref:C3H1-type domain-containing protein n=1 Tax=Vitrella brassicaformis (strain CCMP3155) TaxID=1169540 RepID=A0A0G4GC94_VITBC|nr:unnamed protein product [Vitrella brassicaformis CCMP3155]|eukprot:CEM26466.1 unnamed protein product [Vitrella brassicaformis CCMP3155]
MAHKRGSASRTGGPHQEHEGAMPMASGPPGMCLPDDERGLLPLPQAAQEAPALLPNPFPHQGFPVFPITPHGFTPEYFGCQSAIGELPSPLALTATDETEGGISPASTLSPGRYSTRGSHVGAYDLTMSYEWGGVSGEGDPFLMPRPLQRERSYSASQYDHYVGTQAEHPFMQWIESCRGNKAAAGQPDRSHSPLLPSPLTLSKTKGDPSAAASGDPDTLLSPIISTLHPFQQQEGPAFAHHAMMEAPEPEEPSSSSGQQGGVDVEDTNDEIDDLGERMALACLDEDDLPAAAVLGEEMGEDEKKEVLEALRRRLVALMGKKEPFNTVMEVTPSLASLIPCTASGESMSIGSIWHTEGFCRACVFAFKRSNRCSNGPGCLFCHHPDHRSRAYNKQLKKDRRQTEGQNNNHSSSSQDAIQAASLGAPGGPSPPSLTPSSSAASPPASPPHLPFPFPILPTPTYRLSEVTSASTEPDDHSKGGRSAAAKRPPPPQSQPSGGR